MRDNDSTLPIAFLAASTLLLVSALSGTARAEAPLLLIQPCHMDSDRPLQSGTRQNTDFPIERIHPRAGAFSEDNPECYDDDAERISWKLLYHLNHINATYSYIDKNLKIYILASPANKVQQACVKRLKDRLTAHLKDTLPAACKSRKSSGEKDVCWLVGEAIARTEAATPDPWQAGSGEIEIGFRASSPLKIAEKGEDRLNHACGPGMVSPAVLRCGILGQYVPSPDTGGMLQYEVARIPANRGGTPAIERAAADLLALHASLRNLPSTEPEPRIVVLGPAGKDGGGDRAKGILVRTANKLTPADGIPECDGMEGDPVSKSCLARLGRAQAWIRQAAVRTSADGDLRVVLETNGEIAAKWFNDIVRQSASISCAAPASSVPSLSAPAPAPAPAPETLLQIYFPYASSSLDDRQCTGSSNSADEEHAAICRGLRDLNRKVINRLIRAAASRDHVHVRIVGHASRSSQLNDDDAIARARAHSVHQKIKDLLDECAGREADCQRAQDRLQPHIDGRASTEHSTDQGLGSKQPERHWHYRRVDVILESGVPGR